jgi:hypothetical protein
MARTNRSSAGAKRRPSTSKRRTASQILASEVAKLASYQSQMIAKIAAREAYLITTEAALARLTGLIAACQDRVTTREEAVHLSLDAPGSV